MQKASGRSLDQEDPLEKGMANQSSILAWEIPWTEEPAGLQSRGSQESDTTERLTQTFHTLEMLLRTFFEDIIYIPKEFFFSEFKRFGIVTFIFQG